MRIGVPGASGRLAGERACGDGSGGRLTLRARLIAAFLAVVLGPVLIGAVFVGITVSEVAGRNATERLEFASSSVGNAVATTCRELHFAAEVTATRYSMDRRGAVRAGMATDIPDAVRVADRSGTVVGQQGELPKPWASCSTTGGGSGRPASLVAQVRMADQHGHPVGTVVAAVAVDRAFLRKLSVSADVGVTLLSGGGTPLSTESSGLAVQVAETGRTLHGDDVATTRTDVFVRSVPRSGSQPLALALSTTANRIGALYGVLIGVVVLAGMVAVGAAWWLGNSTTRPLDEVAAAADRVAGGDLEARVPVRSRDEIGKLGSAFNRMTREMQAYVHALTASRDQLRGNLGLLGDTLSSTHDLDRILSVILETAMAATGAQAGVVLLVDGPDGRYPGQLVARCWDGLAERSPSPADVHVALGEGLLGEVARSGEPRRGRTNRLQLSRHEPRCRTYIAVPFSGSERAEYAEPVEEPSERGDQLRGVLALYDRLGQDDFDDADLGTLRTFAGQAAVAVDNVMLHRQAERLSLTDPLTQLWNYRYLQVSLRQETERAVRFDRRLSVLAMDLDRFKEVNDTHGHAAGDAVLAAFARTVAGEIREVDLACRQGGEEFVVLLPETDLTAAGRLADRICTAVRELVVPLPDSDRSEPASISVTVSIGVAVYPDHGGTGRAVLDAADDALYEAKAAGRDTWRVSSRSTGGASRRPRPPRQVRGG
jgi:diguanylate cyclase (GGDEF)-like protein